MPTSNEKRSPHDLKLESEHWDEFIAVLSPKSNDSLESFDEWMSDQLDALETSLVQFSSRSAIKKSLRG